MVIESISGKPTGVCQFLYCYFVYTFPKIELRLILNVLVFGNNINKDNLEVLIHAYEEWKDEFVKRIRGTFALVIWNKEKKELYCARDGFGSKPFYYYRNDGTFMFASEIKAFLEHPKFNKQFNEEILASYLCFNSVATKESFFRGVYRLEPGHYMVVKDDNIVDKVFFRLIFKDSKETITTINKTTNIAAIIIKK